jgi:hypothetical protein
MLFWLAAYCSCSATLLVTAHTLLLLVLLFLALLTALRQLLLVCISLDRASHMHLPLPGAAPAGLIPMPFMVKAILPELASTDRTLTLTGCPTLTTSWALFTNPSCTIPIQEKRGQFIKCHTFMVLAHNLLAAATNCGECQDHGLATAHNRLD